MTIVANDILRLTVATVLGGAGEAANVFYAKVGSIGTATQDDILDACKDYMEAIYAPMLPQMNQNTLIRDVTVARYIPITNEWITEGVRAMAQVGTSITGMLPGVAAASATARTNTPKVQARKRFSGFDETTQDQGVLDGAALGTVVTAAAFWMLGYEVIALNLILESGVFSKRLSDFAPFSGTGLVKNIMGTQVTRKPGRGD